MGRAELESTKRIKRETLTGLLETMAPTDQQPITARVRISDIQAEAAREMAVTLAEPVQAPIVVPVAGELTRPAGVSKVLETLQDLEAVKAARVARLIDELDQIDAAEPLVAPRSSSNSAARVDRLFDELKAIGAAKPISTRPKRLSKAPFSHLAALLPATPIPARPARAKTNSGIGRAEQKAMQVIAYVREKLETPAPLDSLAERPSLMSLSRQVAAELSGEEILMLPMELRLKLAELTPIPFPRIAMTPGPSDVCIDIHSKPCKELGHSIQVSDPVEPAPKWPALVGYFAAACLAGFSAVYYLV